MNKFVYSFEDKYIDFKKALYEPAYKAVLYTDVKFKNKISVFDKGQEVKRIALSLFDPKSIISVNESGETKNHII